MTHPLTPAQQRALNGVHAGLTIGRVVTLGGGTGKGKTTLLRHVHAGHGGAFLTTKEYIDALRPCHPLAMEETFEQLVMGALVGHDCVIVDDLHLLAGVVSGCGNYPRSGFLDAPLTSLTAYAQAAGKKLLFGMDGYTPSPLRNSGYVFHIPDFEAEDYRLLCEAHLHPEQASRLDFPKIHRFAPNLNAHHLRASCLWLAGEEGLDTERFIDYLRSQRMTSNVDLEEVEAVALHDLRGVDDVIASLEANIVLPLENDELATELQLKPKRGVLLAGPPGTGKTTIGRALAHRLKSKFFLVDGTVISGSRDFYSQVNYIFGAAQQNAPAILFIDDSDVIFESGEELGLYRYLLTMLDGLESESAGRVCVMMTAMDVGNLPPALVRSGRIELWLEMRLPDASARADILRRHLAGLPQWAGEADLARVAEATERFTGADLKLTAEDAKVLLANDKVHGRPLQLLTDYLLTATEAVRANRQRYEEAEARARKRQPQRPVYFDGGAE